MCTKNKEVRTSWYKVALEKALARPDKMNAVLEAEELARVLRENFYKSIWPTRK